MIKSTSSTDKKHTLNIYQKATVAKSDGRFHSGREIWTTIITRKVIWSCFHVRAQQWSEKLIYVSNCLQIGFPGICGNMKLFDNIFNTSKPLCTNWHPIRYFFRPQKIVIIVCRKKRHKHTRRYRMLFYIPRPRGRTFLKLWKIARTFLTTLREMLAAGVFD